MKYFFALLVISVLYLESQNNMWRFHLVSDLRVFQNVALGQFDPAYLPGGLLFMLLPSFVNFFNGSYEQIFILLNCFLLLVHFIFYEKARGKVNSWVFLGILLSSGPILLFRFELLVSLLVLMSVVLWEKKKYLISAFLLGFGVSTKLYPLVLFPYFLMRMSKREIALFIKVMLAFAIGVVFPFICLMISGGRLDMFTTSLSSNSLKPIGIESVPASVLTVASMMTIGFVPRIFLGGGVWGLMSDLNVTLFSVIQILVVVSFYAYLYFNNGMRQFRVGAVYFVILLFLFFSKNLNPQYLYWFILIFPLVRYKENGKRDYCVLAIIIMLISFLNQLVFPVLFSDFLNFFSGGGGFAFYINLIKNALLLVLVLLSFKYIFVKKSIE